MKLFRGPKANTKPGLTAEAKGKQAAGSRATGGKTGGEVDGRGFSK